MKVKFVDVRISGPVNTCNVMSVAPIREIDGQLVLWRPFFNSLPQSSLGYLAKLKYRVEDEEFSIPYIPQVPVSDEMNQLMIMYYDSYDYQHYHDEKTMGLANIILVPDRYKEEMAEITKIRMQMDRPVSKFLEREPLVYLLPLIRAAMVSHPSWFVKLSAQSSKHDSHIKAVQTVEDVLDTITNSPHLLRVEWQRSNKPTYVILKPWNAFITDYNEFRMFIWESKVTAVTQQHWYAQLNHSQEYIDTVKNVISHYQHSPKLPPNGTLDVIILEDSTLIIIECNPWICSGSGLFEWSIDYKILYGLEGDVELRLA